MTVLSVNIPVICTNLYCQCIYQLVSEVDIYKICKICRYGILELNNNYTFSICSNKCTHYQIILKNQLNSVCKICFNGILCNTKKKTINAEAYNNLFDFNLNVFVNVKCTNEKCLYYCNNYQTNINNLGNICNICNNGVIYLEDLQKNEWTKKNKKLKKKLPKVLENSIITHDIWLKICEKFKENIYKIKKQNVIKQLQPKNILKKIDLYNVLYANEKKLKLINIENQVQKKQEEEMYEFIEQKYHCYLNPFE
jgi:hypothetical protein